MLLSPTGEWSLSVILNLAFTNLNVSRTSNELDKLELRKKININQLSAVQCIRVLVN